jgi:hypothetical protein
MNKLKEMVISYLNMGLNPTVVSFEDDGLYYLFDKLLKGTEKSNSYDPVYSFVHLTLNYLPEITTESVEQAIEKELQRDIFTGNTILETYDNGVECVCILDDIAFIDDVVGTIKITDNLIKKYRGILRFVYIVEDPLLIQNLKGKISPISSFFDAIMYKRIGEFWAQSELAELAENQFKFKIDQNKLEEISINSNNHLGIFKRLYKDHVLKLATTERYLELLIESLDKLLVNTFKKVIKGVKLTTEEEVIYKAYEEVGFIQDNSITIPLIEKMIKGIVIPNKIIFNNSSGQIEGMDLNLFNTSERAILEALLNTEEIISKNQLGDIIWKEKAKDKYSEWAIDQRIARLRKKLIDLGFNIDIQTIYGQGFKLSFIEKR